MTYKLLQLGSNTWDYDWKFHPSSLFNPICCEKVQIFTSVLNERQTRRVASYYSLGLIFGTMTGPFTHVVFLFPFIAKRKHIRILVKYEYL